MSDQSQQPDEQDQPTQQPGEEGTDTVAGSPKKAPPSDQDKSAQDDED